jgi:hypothetical protein
MLEYENPISTTHILGLPIAEKFDPLSDVDRVILLLE